LHSQFCSLILSLFALSPFTLTLSARLSPGFSLLLLSFSLSVPLPHCLSRVLLSPVLALTLFCLSPRSYPVTLSLLSLCCSLPSLSTRSVALFYQPL
jgi:hypothetical protein